MLWELSISLHFMPKIIHIFYFSNHKNTSIFVMLIIRVKYLQLQYNYKFKSLLSAWRSPDRVKKNSWNYWEQISWGREWSAKNSCSNPASARQSWRSENTDRSRQTSIYEFKCHFGGRRSKLNTGRSDRGQKPPQLTE